MGIEQKSEKPIMYRAHLAYPLTGEHHSSNLVHRGTDRSNVMDGGARELWCSRAI